MHITSFSNPTCPKGHKVTRVWHTGQKPYTIWYCDTCGKKFYGYDIRKNPFLTDLAAAATLGGGFTLGSALGRMTEDWIKKKWGKGKKKNPAGWQELLHKTLKFNPLTPDEKSDLYAWGKKQYAISRHYQDDPVRSEFYWGRAVAAGKVAKMFGNPIVKCPSCGHKVSKWNTMRRFPNGSMYLCPKCHYEFWGESKNPSRQWHLDRSQVHKETARQMKKRGAIQDSFMSQTLAMENEYAAEHSR